MAKAQNSNGSLYGALMYVKVDSPKKKFTGDDMEWSAAVVVDKATKQAFVKNKFNKTAKEIPIDEFEEIFHVPVPEMFEGMDEVYQIQINQAATRDGVPVNPDYHPHVYLDVGGGKWKKITTTRLVANGSVGELHYRIYEDKAGKKNLNLSHLVIKEENFIEYEKRDGKLPQGITVIEDDDEPSAKVVQEKAPEKEAAKLVAKKPAKPVVVEDDDDIPF